MSNPRLFPTNIYSSVSDSGCYHRDYFGQNGEALHQFLRLFSDAGTPDGTHSLIQRGAEVHQADVFESLSGFVNMDAFTGHSYRWVKKDGEN